jgi:hypothetical protein
MGEKVELQRGRCPERGAGFFAVRQAWRAAP